jgi:hypothetical protein
MKNLNASVLLAASMILGCSSPQTSDATPTGSSSSAPSASTPVVEVPKPADSVATPTPEPSATTPTPEPSATTPAPTGRLAFTQCAEADRKVRGCTKEMNPVCGEVDTGIRCIRAPCPSSVKRTFSNACSACQEAKTTGYWPMSCEDMAKPSSNTL